MVKPPFFCASPKSVQTLNAPGARDVAKKAATSPEREARGKSETMARVKKAISSPLTKKRQGTGAKRVFGVPLDDGMRDAAPGEVVPNIVVKVCSFIDREGMCFEGIFRVSGNQKVVEKLKAEFDRRGDADLRKVQDVAAVASVLKQFLRELPVPPIPNELKPQFLSAYSRNQDKPVACANELASLVMHLPAAHLQLIKYIVRFLVKISLNEAQNKMGVVALAIVFGPNFFQLSDGLVALKEQQFINGVIAIFMQYYDVIFKGSNEESLKGQVKSPPAKPLPFREHLKQKQKRLTHYGGMNEECGNDGEMTVCGDGREEIDLPEEATSMLAKTLNEKDLPSARERRRRTLSQRPLPDPLVEGVRRNVRSHHYEEVLLTDDVNAKPEGSGKKAEREVSDVYAVPNKTKCKTQPKVTVVEVVSTPISDKASSSSSHFKDVTPAVLTKANVDRLNAVNDCAETVDEDPTRTASPWSVSSGAASPMPLTPRYMQQLTTVIHATVTKHLFGPCGENEPEGQTENIGEEEVQLKSTGVSTVEALDKGITLKDDRRSDGVKGHVANWEERILQSKGKSLPSDVVSDDVANSPDTDSDRKKTRPKSEAFDMFERGGKLIHFGPLPAGILNPSDFTGPSKREGKPAVPKKPVRRKKDVSSTPVVEFSTSNVAESEVFDSVRRHSTTGMLTSLTASRPSPPRNRRSPRRRQQENGVVVTDLDGTVTAPVVKGSKRPAIVPPLDLSQLTKSSRPRHDADVKVTAWSSGDREEVEEDRTDDVVRAEVQTFQPSPETPRRELGRTDGRRPAGDVSQFNDGRVDGPSGLTSEVGGVDRSERPQHPTVDSEKHINMVQPKKLTARAIEVKDLRKDISHELNGSGHRQPDLKLPDMDRNSSSLIDGMSRKELTKAYYVRRRSIRAFEEQFEKEHQRKPDKSEYGPVQDEQKEFRILRRKVKEAKREQDGHKNDESYATPAAKLDSVDIGKVSTAAPQSDTVRHTSPPVHEETSAAVVSPTSEVASIRIDPQLLAALSSDEMTRLTTLSAAMEKCDSDFREKRTLQGRPEDLSSMTLQQLREEKQDVQRALLLVEKSHGRPRNLAEKETTRRLYNRYRMVKQVLSDWAQSGVQACPTMTAMQMADERLRRTERQSSSPEDTKEQASPKDLADSGIQADQRLSTERNKPVRSDTLPSASSVDTGLLVESVGSTLSVDVFTSVGSGGSVSSPTEFLTSASTEELLRQLQEQTQTKKSLRVALKIFEAEFEQKHGRKVGKADRSVMEVEYEQYKKVKSSMKRIERLLSEKQETAA